MVVVLAALALLMVLSYRGYSPILVAPFVAMLAVAFTDVTMVFPAFTGLFMERFASFMKLYFPVILLGAAFGRLLEISGMVATIAERVERAANIPGAIAGVVLLTALLTYGGVSVFVVAFATFPFGALLFRKLEIPKRLLPAMVLLGGGSFAMTTMPGSPQLPNIIPIGTFGTTSWAAPVLGLIASAAILGGGLLYLIFRAGQLRSRGEGYGSNMHNEPEQGVPPLRSLALAIAPLAVVFIGNLAFMRMVLVDYGKTTMLVLPGLTQPVTVAADRVEASWAICAALILGCISICLLDGGRSIRVLRENVKNVVSGALVSSAAIASMFGFGATLAALPGFLQIKAGLSHIHDPLLNAVASTSVIAAMAGSAAGGVNITLDTFGPQLLAHATDAGIPAEVLHRLVAAAAGSFDTMPHNGMMISFMLVCGMSHRESYADMFGLTLIKSAVAFALVPLFYWTGWV